MRTLQKSNSKSHLMTWLSIALFGVLSACSSAKQPSAEIPMTTQTTSNQVSEKGSAEDLSTKAVAPVGIEKFMGIFTPYRITVQQGNFVSKEMADQVKEGMTREQVRFILGTALLTDMFHADRWDYIFRLLKPSGELITSRMTVYFQQSMVAKIERGDLPNEQEYLAIITSGGAVDSP